jgi:hypothetical protein
VAIIREHWPAFRERVEMHAGPLPGFVRGTCTTATVTARTVEVVHAELNPQLASSSRDDALGSAFSRIGPRRPPDPHASFPKPANPRGWPPQLHDRPLRDA